MRKIDLTQPEIVAFLRAVGMFVFSLASVGRGCPDLLCAYREHWYVVEVKTGTLGWKYTTAQRRFHKEARAPIVVLTSVEDAEEWVRSLSRLTTVKDPREANLEKG